MKETTPDTELYCPRFWTDGEDVWWLDVDGTLWFAEGYEFGGKWYAHNNCSVTIGRLEQESKFYSISQEEAKEIVEGKREKVCMKLNSSLRKFFDLFKRS